MTMNEGAMRHSKTETPLSIQPRLLDQVRARIRTKHYSRRTEEAYVRWIVKFILFHKKKHPFFDPASRAPKNFCKDMAIIWSASDTVMMKKR